MTEPIVDARGGNRSPVRPKGMAYVHGVVGLAVVLLVALVALAGRPPPPPTIAELSPQAQAQVKEAPSEQSSAFGSGGGGAGGGTEGGAAPPPGAATTTSTSVAATQVPTIDVARVRRCIGNPPRQIEDPQSPPCVPYWEGDNGGATSPGVTRDQINIVVPNWSDDMHPRLEAFFNNRFELYGRRLKLVPLQGSNSTDDANAQRADATKAVEVKAFASLDYSGGNIYYYDELARRGVISATHQAIFPEKELAARHPYVWQYPMSVDRIYGEIGRWACARLAGQKASHAGPPYADRTRTFGVIQQYYSEDYDLPTTPLKTALAQCGAKVENEVRYRYDLDPQKATNAAVQMSQAGVSTIICLCHVLSAGSMARASTSQGYLPEWLVSTYLLSDYNALFSASFPPEQRTRTMALSFIPKQVKPADVPANWALREADASKGSRENSLELTPLNVDYRTLLLIASGIQLAGPNLTPEAFARGLQRATFPNPDTPIYAGKVGFSASSHSMTIDTTEMWWGEGRPGPTSDNTNGAFCYVDRGARRASGKYPPGDPFFSSTCDTGA